MAKRSLHSLASTKQLPYGCIAKRVPPLAHDGACLKHKRVRLFATCAIKGAMFDAPQRTKDNGNVGLRQPKCQGMVWFCNRVHRFWKETWAMATSSRKRDCAGSRVRRGCGKKKLKRRVERSIHVAVARTSKQNKTKQNIRFACMPPDTPHLYRGYDSPTAMYVPANEG